MRDVAKLAGVSHQTVSRVLNEHANVRPETRDRVLDAMRHLDYQRNTAARALVTRKSQTLGLITFDTTLVGPASMVYGIERAARDAGYFVSIVSVRTLERGTVLDAIKRLREQAVEGIIAVAPEDTAVAALSRVPENLPIVGVGVGRSEDVCMVGVDNRTGARQAIDHLLSLGHRTIAHIGGPPTWPEAKEREAGWREALHAAGIIAPEPTAGDWSARSGYEAGLALARERSVTAVFCANDQTAIGLLSALYRAGLKVPQDVSVVGFDDIPEAPYLYPPLTTVRQDFSAVGRQSFELLLQQINTRTRSTERMALDPELILRESTCAPA
ncbi:MAG: LacI family DNA-binding transcriptional regulator [Micromonosporaceae bacterium]|nr:LacI family DNA-binding transcriptional regulator [Micromonosporaceae bacterium]